MATQSTSYVIRGQLKDGGVGGPVASAGVCVLDAATRREIGTAETDSAGWFSISLSSDQADIALGGSAAVSLLFAFTASGGLIGGFEKSITRAEMKSAAVHEFTVGSATPGSNPYFIGGTVVDSEGAAVAFATVKFFEHLLPSTSPTSIGTTTSDANGHFLFNYSYTGSSDPESVRATIVAIAEIGVMGIPTDVGQSGPHCNPSKNHVMRIVIPKDAATGAPIPSDLSDVEYRGVPEYDQLVGRIGAVVTTPPSGDLTAEDIQALACRTGYTPSEIAVWANADALSGQTSIDEEAIYALGRLGVPQNIGALLTLADADVQSGLEDAVARGLLSESYSSSIAATVTAFSTERVNTTLTDPATSAPTVTADMLTNGGISGTQQNSFFTSLYSNTDPIETFWANLRADTVTYRTDEIDRIQFAIRAGAVAANHTKLVEYLQNNKWGVDLATARDLAKYSETDIAGFLTQSDGGTGTVGAPPNFPGADQTEREANYAKAVSRAVDDVFATEAVAYRVTSTAITTDVSGFVSENSNFDFRTTVIDDFWTGASIPVGVTDPDALKAELKTIQRVFNIAPRIGRVDAVKALLDNGIRSAFQASQFGAAAFAKKFATALGSKQAAKRAWKRADQIASKNLAVWAKFNPNLAVSNTLAMPTPGCGLADLETLFGGADYCACEPCVSVYSPAAYMVEVLVWLENRDSLTAGKSLLDILEEEHGRTDIRHTMLNCENTETPMPTIDLVNELLERAVVKVDGGVPAHPEPQTTWTADELRAHPENVDDGAYSILSNAAKGVHPWNLPFSLPLAESRVYMEHLGAKRIDVMDAMELFPDTDGNTDEEESRRNERLGLSKAQADLIIRPLTVVSGSSDLWGLSGASWLDDLKKVREFMRRSGLSFEEVQDLLKTEVGSSLTIVFANDDCDVDTATIEDIAAGPGLDAAKATEIQALLRLSKALGMPVREVDAILRATGSTLDTIANADAALFQVADVVQLKGRFPRFHLGEILSWFSKLDLTPWKDDDVSFYESVVFPAQMSAGWSVTSIDAVGGAGQLQDVAGELAGVAAVSEEDLNRITTFVGYGPTQTIELNEVTTVFLIASQASAAGLSVEEYLALRELNGTTGALPGGQREGQRLSIIFDDAEVIKRSRLSVADIEFVILGRNAENFDSDDDAVALQLIGLIEGLQAVVADEAAKVPTPDLAPEQQMASVLGRIYPPGADLDDALLIAAGTYTYGGGSDAKVDELFDFVTDAQTVVELKLPLASRTLGSQPTTASNVVADAVAMLEQAAIDSFTVQYFAEQLAVSAADASLLLGQFEPAGLPGTSALTYFTDSAFRAVEVNPDEVAVPGFGTAFNAQGPVAGRDVMVRRLQKAGLVASAHGYSGSALGWIMQPPATFSSNVLDLRSLPSSEMAPDANTPDQFYAWMWLVMVASIRGRFAEDAGVFEALDKADSGTEAEFFAELAAGTEIAQSDIEGVMTDLTFPGDYASMAALEEFFAVVDMAKRVGVTPGVLRTWANTVEPDASQADEIRSAARSKYDASKWPDIAEPIRNKLREKQRDVLADWLISKLGLNSDEDLLDAFLIDAKVSSCGRTSRIKSAISALQLFIQRSFLNLELQVELDQDDSIEWDWMKRYRVWEASRKIFLYPEDYLAPELRQDKTELFKQLEDEILEGDVTQVAAERAYVRYLRGLDEISNLEIAGVYHELERDADDHVVVDKLHVFGRTRSDPKKMFYRVRTNGAVWSPWESVPVEMGNPDVLPVVQNRKLVVFWPSVAEKTVEPAQDEESPVLMLSITLNWAEYADGEWSGPYRSAEAAETRDFVPKVTIRPEGREVSRERDYIGVWLHGHSDGPDLLVDVTILSDAEAEANVEAIFSGVPLKVVGTFKYGGCRAGLESTPVDNVPQRTWVTTSGPARVFPYFQSWRPSSKTELRLTAPEPNSKEAVSQDLIVTPSLFQVDGHRHNNGAFSLHPFFVADSERTFMFDPRDEASLPSSSLELKDDKVGPQMVKGLSGLGYVGKVIAQQGEQEKNASNIWPNYTYSASTFYHPYACDMVKHVRRYGVEGLLNAPDPALGDYDGSHLACQSAEQELMYKTGEQPGDAVYEVAHVVNRSFPVENFDFTGAGAYSVYNWELFFHIPLFIAERLMSENRFDDAQKWLHYIFDPTQAGDSDGCTDFWRIKPFKEGNAQQSIQDLLAVLGADGGDVAAKIEREQVEAEIEMWRENPFDPHLVARFRPEAYQRAIFFKYVDLLVEWGDHLFRQDSIESNNEATQLYVLAKKILGDRPVGVDTAEGTAKSFDDAVSFDALSNFLVDAENSKPNQTAELKLVNVADQDPLPYGQLNFDLGDGPNADWIKPKPIKLVAMAVDVDVGGQTETQQYFCVPPSEHLTSYWDIVDDRLFKLRNCLNIDGVFRSLPLFQPPIDPALLARAAAAGVDLASAIAGLSAALPHYKFRTMLSMAKELAGEVRSFGGLLLSAWEKKDAEALSQLRASQDVTLQSLVKMTRELQIKEAESAIESTIASRGNAQQRIKFYGSRMRRSELEEKANERHQESGKHDRTAKDLNLVSGILGLIPQFGFGLEGVSPLSVTTLGGQQLAGMMRVASEQVSFKSRYASRLSQELNQKAVYLRRDEDWSHQLAVAGSDLEAIDKQVISSEIRKQIAEQELRNHERSVEHVEQIEAFLRDKFSNEDLYFWMQKEVSKMYYQAYKLAVDVARRAERCLQYELADNSLSFISYGYWDSARKGLLAGERLIHDLHRMEVAYLENNRREYELTKRVSLAELAPNALEDLKSTGTCSFVVPEWLLDMDHPSHYMRRIKMVSVTLPAVGGPFTETNATLTYERGSILRDPLGSLELDPMSTVETIAVSTGQDDAGMFEPNMRDERYLPFEGKGLDDSQWRLKLPASVHKFDYRTLTDAIITVRYTAREGGETLGNDKVNGPGGLVEKLTGGPLYQVVSVRSSFPDAWSSFLSEGLAGNNAVAEMDLDEQAFPYKALADKGIAVTGVTCLLWRGRDTTASIATTPTLTDAADVSVSTLGSFSSATGQQINSTGTLNDLAPATWKFTIPGGFSGGTPEDEPRDLILVFEYKLA